MRTVDPVVWSESLKKPKIDLTRPNKFGKKINTDWETSFRKSFCNAFKEYTRNTSVTGIKYMVNEEFSKMERRWWRVMVGGSVVVVAYAIASSFGDGSASRALEVSMHSTRDSIREVPFPGVALCTTNIISKRAVLNYSQYIFSKDVDNIYSQSFIYNYLVSHGSLLTMTNKPSVDLNFLQYLMKIDPSYTVTDIMYQLSPSCEELLVRCSWRGHARNCSDLFSLQPTSSGYCCLFNSRYRPEDKDRLPESLDITGHDYGLSAMVYINESDYAYLKRNFFGTEVMIFNPQEYPLREGGTVQSYWLWPNLAYYLTVSVTEKIAGYSTKTYSVKTRECTFNDNSSASYSTCLTACRRRSLYQLCKCVPYFIPHEATDRTCSLNHLACLIKHLELFLYYNPQTKLTPEHVAGLQEELQNSLFCPECVPDCETTKYKLRSYVTRYDHNQSLFRNYLTENVGFKNVSTLHVFYNTKELVVYSLDVTAPWFEVLSGAGGAGRALGGAALAAGAELLFCLTVRWRHHLRLRRRPGGSTH